MKKVFIGIDFSKLTLDVSVLKTAGSVAHHVFDNSKDGYSAMLEWIRGLGYRSKAAYLFCGEHTGLYSVGLVKLLNAKGIDIWMVSGLEVKLSLGISRDKSDKVDSANIALYAYRFQDKAASSKLRSAVLDELQDLLAYRERLKKQKHALSVSASELSRVKQNASVSFIAEDSRALLDSIAASLNQLEQRVQRLLKSEQELYESYSLLLSIKGVGPQNAVMMLVLTDSFSRFTDARKFGCYCGVVPFKRRSGTSLHKRDKVSQLANKQMKVLLTSAAKSAVRNNPDLKAYYQRKLQEGKDSWLVINNVRNKLVHIMFAVVRSKKPYCIGYQQALSQAS